MLMKNLNNNHLRNKYIRLLYIFFFYIIIVKKSKDNLYNICLLFLIYKFLKKISFQKKLKEFVEIFKIYKKKKCIRLLSNEFILL